MTDPPSPADQLSDRLDALARIVDLGAGRLPEPAVENARQVLRRAASRRALSGEHTVVALAGSTGSGKSSLFNAISGVDLSTVGIRRPTTGAVHACVWGMDGAAELLDWLAVPEQHRVARDTVLDTAPSPLAGLVLLDLPDHDSADESHRKEVDRLVEVVDVLVWVVDPQKYADRVVHEEFLQPMAAHSAVVVVALNQVDRLEASDVDACVADLRRLLAEDGLTDARVVRTSATADPGVTELDAVLVETVQSHRAAADRMSADAVAASRLLLAYHDGTQQTAGVTSEAREELLHTLVQSSGIGTLGGAVADATRRRGLAFTAWPPFWLARRLRRSPSLRLASGEQLTGLAVEQAPAAAPLPLAHVDGALRAVSDASSSGLPAPWPGRVRSASRARADALVDVVDGVLAAADVATVRVPLGWWVVRVLQWLSLLAVVVGAVLVLVGAVGGSGLLLGALLAGGGVVTGLAIELFGRIAVRNAARRRGEAMVAQLRDEIARGVREYVLEPVETELDAYSEIGRELSTARGA